MDAFDLEHRFRCAFSRMERQCDEMIAAVLIELGEEPPTEAFWRNADV